MPRTSRRLADLIRNNQSDRLLLILENSGPNNTVVMEKDDLRPEILGKLSRFASDVTVATQNDITVTNVFGKLRLQDEFGNPSVLTPPNENAQEHYSQRFARPSNDGISAEQEFNRTSSTGFLDVDESKGGKFVIRKGRSNINAPTGDSLIQEVNEKGEKSEIAKRVRQAQLDNNRYTLGKTYVPRTGLEAPDGISITSVGSEGSGTALEDESNIGIAHVQQEFGKHGPRKFPRVHGNDTAVIKIKDLKKLGLLTLLQASGEYYIPTEPNDAEQQVAARGASFAPGLARLGQKINISKISPLKIMKDVNPNFTKPTLDDNLKKNDVLTYGNVNNWLVPFSGLSSTASIASAALLSLTIGGIIKGIALAIAPKTTNPVIPGAALSKEDRRKRLGSYLGKYDINSQFKNADYLIKTSSTKHDYFQAVSRGVNIFFGTSDIGKQSESLIQNHGYYNTLIRSLIKNSRDIVFQAFGGVSSEIGATDIADVGLIGNPAGPIEIARKVNESKLLQFCNVLASIGDIALSHEHDGFLPNEIGGIDEVISDVDRIQVEISTGQGDEKSLNPAVLQSVDRLPSQYRNALAWGSNTVKSMYLIPNGLSRAESRFLGASQQSGNPSEVLAADLSINNLHVVKGPDNLDGNRISAEDVENLEKQLDADYMPFYFHDLRTNEIISFHAFLEDMNDGFDAEYVETEGYGRIGSTYGYKNTKRSISLGFRVVATNHKDFDHMWFKINKLITLVYPQYTEGRQIGTSTERFIQPFSQVPSASPMIRLRLGDLFKSNYSKFALARLFGVGSSQFSLEGESARIVRDTNFAAAREKVTQRMSRRGEYEVGEHALLTPLHAPGGRGSGQRTVGYPRVGNTIDSPSQPAQTARRGVGGRAGAGIQAGYSVLNQEGRRVFSPNESPAGQALQVMHQMRVRITNKQTTTQGLFLYHFVIPNGGVGYDGIYSCTQHDLMPDPSEITRVAANQVGTQTAVTGSTDNRNVVNDFFSSTGVNGNPIVKAFESTKGKGLAGFIRSLKFDWSDARWETGRANARAPMSVKIAMEFTPIFDISPGLDSEGFMTAPVYNVGNTMKHVNEMPENRSLNEENRTNLDRAVFSSQPRNSSGTANVGGSVGRIG